MSMNTQTDEEIYRTAVRFMQDKWVPACGGKEVPFEKNGYRLLYCYNPKLGKHAYLNLQTDLILSTEEAERIFR